MENTSVKNPNKKWNLSLLAFSILNLAICWGLWNMTEPMGAKIKETRAKVDFVADIVDGHSNWIHQVAPIQHTHVRPETNNTQQPK